MDDPNWKQDFGKRLRQAREQRELSQEKLGKLIGYKNPRSDISNIERGHMLPSLEKTIQLSYALEQSIDKIIFG